MIVGIGILAVLTGLALLGRLAPPRHVPVDIAGLLWLLFMIGLVMADVLSRNWR